MKENFPAYKLEFHEVIKARWKKSKITVKSKNKNKKYKND